MHSSASRRILQGVAATLTHQFTDADGIAAAPAGTVTVSITKADGTAVVTTAATSGASTDPRSYVFAGSNTLELLTVTWTDTGNGATFSRLVEVVGGYYFSPVELRERDSSLSDASAYPDAAIVRARWEAETQCEDLTRVAWVPRYRRARIGQQRGPHIRLDDQMIRTVRSVRTYSDAITFSTYTADQLARLVVGDSELAQAGIIAGSWCGGAYPSGWHGGPYPGVVVEYEYGLDRPPEDIRSAAMLHTRNILNEWKRSGLLDRATQFQPIDGGNVLLATPGRFGFDTGIPEVDAIYQRHSRPVLVG